MIIADQDDVGRVNRVLNLLRVEDGIVMQKSLVELANVLTPAVRILSPDLALHSRQRLQLRRTASGPQVRRRRHELLFSSYPELHLHLSP